MGTIRVGRPQAHHDTSRHVPGMHQGNKGPYAHQSGHHKDGTSDARRSTGIHSRQHDAISKIMPNISPG
ncbi:hypothetical protein LK07_32340 [Streptomyces pluripotens]|uniref:Uncharacterized protein n=1 Tax=Streptomyces pluripotens TaxID=1355015 RepID=A0A221P737_9ACTN|nr:MULTISPECIES: hypothetical protein [Streptomyces]ARP73687.1 hypothetical protein LK06_031140 [Streptomyces pluripotens]ASN27934.1 hypothetical protein LK07_32340 [Streptomyces pluripotens]KIE24355.1 hypothetical protein LK08_25115 [Streptomyces sp. MUSC 125]MCH0559459.1 hypothetical protein [Streptomyces sp. MUM 16J]